MSTSEAASVVDPVSQRDIRSADQDSLQNETLSNNMKKSKTRRLAKAKAEVARLKLELAQARLALIELESSDEELKNEQSELISVVKLPAFNGNHHEWVKFRAAYYESANRLTEAENMSRLRRSLQGKAKKAIKGCTDPEHIMKTLQLRFSPDSLAKAEFERLKTLRLLSDSKHELKLFATEIESVARKLQQWNCHDYLYGMPAASLIGTLLLDTLPRFRNKWYHLCNNHANRMFDLPSFCGFIRREAEKWLL